MKFDHENPKDKIFSDISLVIMLDIPTAFTAYHISPSLLSIDEHQFKHIFFIRRSSFKGFANKDLHVLWNYVR